MRVYLCRHARAAAGEPDELRPLTAEGERDARRLGERLATAAEPPTIVLTSPLLRARQTAEAIALAAGVELRVEPALAPGLTAESLVETVAPYGAAVAAVGHQPDCSEIAVALSGRDPGFPPAGMAELDLS